MSGIEDGDPSARLEQLGALFEQIAEAARLGLEDKAKPEASVRQALEQIRSILEGESNAQHA